MGRYLSAHNWCHGAVSNGLKVKKLKTVIVAKGEFLLVSTLNDIEYYF